MSTEFMVGIVREAMEIALLLSAPVLSVGLVLGLLTSILQAVTQLQEMSLTFIPKLLGVAAVLLLLSPWMLRILVTYTATLIENIPQYIR